MNGAAAEGVSNWYTAPRVVSENAADPIIVDLPTENGYIEVMTGTAAEGVSNWYTTPLFVCDSDAAAGERVSFRYTTTLPAVRRRVTAVNYLVNASVCRRVSPGRAECLPEEMRAPRELEHVRVARVTVRVGDEAVPPEGVSKWYTTPPQVAISARAVLS